MVDAIISPFVEKLISVAVDEVKEQVCLVADVGKEMKRLESNLKAIQAELDDTGKGKAIEGTVRHLSDELKDASYDMEDVLDEWNYAKLKVQIESASQKKVFPYFLIHCSCFKQLVVHCGYATKIKEINQKLDFIIKQKHIICNLSNIKSIEPSKQIASISKIDESKITGRVTEKNILIDKLVCESSGKQNDLHIISLVGVGGIGKTTVAQLAYNSKPIENYFEKRIWVWVSNSFDAFRLAKAIIEGLNVATFDSVSIPITGKKFPHVLEDPLTEYTNKFRPSNLVEFETLTQFIQHSTKGKKFLLVLDDMWEEDHSSWEPFYCCLKNGACGSKILITTPKETVASMMKSYVIPVKELTDEQCWSLLQQEAFPNKCNGNKTLEEIGQKIAGKCKGFPRTAKIIGKFLHSKKNEAEWRRILDKELWELDVFRKHLLSSLLLSYNNLDSTMTKRCFLYCAVFPKNYDINKEELIQLWMAQGYLSDKENEDMEIIGSQYFDNIISHSFFRELEKDDDVDVTRYKLHDILHGFARFLNENECLIVEDNGTKDIDRYREKVRHLTVMLGERVSFPTSICNFKKLRSLFVHGDCAKYASVSDILPKLFSELKCLRALGIHGVLGCQHLIKEIPGEIGKLIHLAYLNLSGQGIEKLPETFCELYNLQTLNINRCQFLKELPHRIGNLINLRYLLNFGTRSLSYMPVGIGKLASLLTLTIFVVDGGVHGSKACKLKALENPNLSGSCQIRGLGNVSDACESERLQLQNVKKLVDVYLEFNRDKEEERMDKKDEALLATFQPPQSLKRLKIGHYRGNIFPSSWTMSLTSVRDLRLIDCLNCKHLPPLGKLASLEKLVIQNLKNVDHVGDEFLGIDGDEGTLATAFQKLKSLVISQMENLEDWDYTITRKGKRPIEIMPLLSFLEIDSCPKLKALPDHLLHTQTLNIKKSPILEDWGKEKRGLAKTSDETSKLLQSCASRLTGI